MKNTVRFFVFMMFALLMTTAVYAAPAQKYNLMANGGKLTAYMIEDDIYIRPQELAQVCAGTSINYDMTYENGILIISLNKDFSGEVKKLKCKSAYDDIPIVTGDFRVEGIDATGHMSCAPIEEENLVRLKDMGIIVGFIYTRDRESGELKISRTPSGFLGFGGAGLSADEYIDIIANVFYGALLSNDNVRVISDSAEIARMLTPAYSVDIPASAKSAPFSEMLAASISASLKESDARDVDPDKPMVALTFDDGPREGNTEQILEALDAVDGRATFFMVGTNVENYPDTVRAVAEQGSELANHSYNHPQLTTLGTDGAMEQINKTNDLIYNAAGVRPTIGRPPYGSINEDIIAASGMDWFNWSVDTLDWKTRNADAVCDVILSEVGDRDVILMHDIHSSTVEAAVRIIPKLHEMGYQLVTISELAEVEGGAENVSGHIKE
ncbi:MAG: polysaccharide deacetylase family protein [Firmicutes bacterium]|nr:polysaccharide deacetylase family protein [Bacillota bacterium]MBQ9604680.1 polysaccharide deacetylase family protein [Bacillota bacterium]